MAVVADDLIFLRARLAGVHRRPHFPHPYAREGNLGTRSQRCNCTIEDMIKNLQGALKAMKDDETYFVLVTGKSITGKIIDVADDVVSVRVSATNEDRTTFIPFAAIVHFEKPSAIQA